VVLTRGDATVGASKGLTTPNTLLERLQSCAREALAEPFCWEHPKNTNVVRQANHDRTTAATLYTRLRQESMKVSKSTRAAKVPRSNLAFKRWRIPRLKFHSSVSSNSLLEALSPSDQSFDMPVILDTMAQRAPQAPAPAQVTIQTQITVTTQDADARSYVTLLCPISLNLVADQYL
jgi:hypothetical protein